jgi:ankyrin repeat protein
MDIFAEVRRGNIDALHAYLAEGNSVDTANLDGSTLLHEATGFGHLDCVQLLVTSGARRDSFDHCGHGNHPIHIASENGYIDIIRELIADKNNISAGGSTALHLAIYNNHFECAKYLIHAGADLDVRDWDYKTPLYVGVLIHNLDIVKHLVSAGSDFHSYHPRCTHSPYELAKLLNHYDILMYFDSMEFPIKEWASS